MKDNYERDEKLSMCDDCINRFNWEKCNTCKHRKKFTQVPGTSPFPLWPFNIEPYRTIPLRYPDSKLYCNSQQDKVGDTNLALDLPHKNSEVSKSNSTARKTGDTAGTHNQTKKKGGVK